MVREVDEVGGVGVDALGVGDGLREGLVGCVWLVSECADDEGVEVVEFGVFFFGDEGYVGEVCHVANAVACDGEFAV